MKANDLLVIMTVALGTATLTVLTLWPGTVDAGNDVAVPAQIQKPKLISHGLELTLTTPGGGVPKAGETPVFELKAISVTNVASAVCLRVAMSASSPADALSRAIRMPAVLWVDTQEVKVGPGETKSITLTCGTNLPPNKFISVSLQDVPALETSASTTSSLSGLLAARSQLPGTGIVALNFSTVVPAPAAPLVTLR